MIDEARRWRQREEKTMRATTRMIVMVVRIWMRIWMSEGEG
jgi:hypothetical protein